MTNTIRAIYETVTAIAGFIQSVTGWFGFGTLTVLFGLLFFYKLFQSLFPTGRRLNYFFSFVVFTALWLTWNKNYYHDFQWLRVVKIYALLFSYALGFYLVFRALSFFGEKISGLFRRKTKLSVQNTLEVYDAIDETSRLMKQNIKTGNASAAIDCLKSLQSTMENLKTPKALPEAYTENK